MGQIVLIVSAVTLVVVVVQFYLLRKASSSAAIERDLASVQKNIERLEQQLRDELARNREELSKNARSTREEGAQSFKELNESILKRMTDIATLQKQQLDTFSNQLTQLTQMNEQKLNLLRGVVEQQLKVLQDDNSKKLEQIRQTVDEKLHSTLEKRLGESFKQVSNQLEQVYKGLGEMQTLATGVGDLKRVLSNVKVRGTWGEVQLGNLLEQILTPEQFAKNVAVKKNSRERVEFAIKLPGGDGHTVWLPIDAKFPIEDYQKLTEAQDKAQVSAIEELGKALETRIKAQAKDIKDKYIDPPHTTDFGVLFLPNEGLYAEVLRRPGLWELVQREYRIIITGPTTIAALLNSLQMGFRTLAIEKRASEVWMILGAVKTEFGKFGEILERTHKKIQEASNTIDEATKKSRTIERKLKDVQQLPAGQQPLMVEHPPIEDQ